MKTRHILYASLVLGTCVGSHAWAGRDPFWPIGYEPPKPEPAEAPAASEAALKKPEQQKPKPPAVKPITEADWIAARKALVISGYTQAVRPDTGQTRTLAMVNRRMVAVGDTVAFVHQAVRFIWKVESIVSNTIQLVPVKAEHVVENATHPDQK